MLLLLLLLLPLLRGICKIDSVGKERGNFLGTLVTVPGDFPVIISNATRCPLGHDGDGERSVNRPLASPGLGQGTRRFYSAVAKHGCLNRWHDSCCSPENFLPPSSLLRPGAGWNGPRTIAFEFHETFRPGSEVEKLCLPRFVLIILGELCRDTINSFIRNKVECGVISRFQGFKRFGNFFFFYVCFVFNRDRINYYGSIIKLIWLTMDIKIGLIVVVNRSCGNKIWN